MTHLPETWAFARLEDLAAGERRAMTDGPFGSNLKTAHYTDSGPRVIRLQNIGDGEFIDEYAHISQDHFETLSEHSVEAGDLVVASLGTDLPRSCVVPPHVPPAIVKADCIRVRLHPEINVKYVNFALQRPELRHATADQIHGVGRPRLGMKGIRALTIPVAPVAEQERIVAAIEEHFSHLDAAESSLCRAERQLERLHAKLTHQEFAGAGGPTRTIGDIAEVQGGIQKQPKRKPRENRFPFLRVANVRRNELVLDDVHEIELFPGELDTYQLQAGDLLVVEGNGSPEQIGRSASWDGSIEPCVHQNHLIRVRPGPMLDGRYLNWFWNSPSTARSLSEIASSTSGLYTLSTKKVRQVEIPVPSLDVQRQVADRLDNRSESLRRLSNEVARCRAKSAGLRRAVLSAAFAGRLVAQDPTSESASDLLERIRVAAPDKKSSRTRKPA